MTDVSFVSRLQICKNYVTPKVMLKTDTNRDSVDFADFGRKTCLLWFILGTVYH